MSLLTRHHWGNAQHRGDTYDADSHGIVAVEKPSDLPATGPEALRELGNRVSRIGCLGLELQVPISSGEYIEATPVRQL